MTGLFDDRAGDRADDRAGDRAASGRRRGRARHAAPAAVGRATIAACVAAAVALTVAGVLLAVRPWDDLPPAGAVGVAGAGLVLIALGGVPVTALLVRRRADLRAVAGERPARTAPVAAALGPVVTVAGCLWVRGGSTGGNGPVVPVGVSVAVLLVLLLVQGWGLSALWHRAAGPAAPPGPPGPGAEGRPGGDGGG